jgi:hypothetical protein
VAHEVVEEEVVQLVRADRGLGELRDLPLGIGRQELGRDRRVEDAKSVSRSAVESPADQVEARSFATQRTTNWMSVLGTPAFTS